MTDPKDNGMFQNGNAGSGYNAGVPGTYPGPAQNTDPSIGMVVGFGSEDAAGMIGMMGMMGMMSMMNQPQQNPGVGSAPVAGAVPPAGTVPPAGPANNMNNGQQAGQVLPPGHWKCKNCGAVSGGKFCPECGKPGPWKCAKCGTMATGNFCPECGSERP